MKIFNKIGTEIYNFEIDEATTINRRLMVENTLSLSLSTEKALNFQIGDYVDFGSERYTLQELPSYALKDGVYSYDGVVFVGNLHRLDYYILTGKDGDPQGVINNGWRDWFYFGTVVQHIDMVMRALSRKESGWEVVMPDIGNLDDPSPKNINYESTSILGALNKLCEKELGFGMEFDIIDKKIYFASEIRYPQNICFEYGMGKGLYSISRGKIAGDKIVTRLWGFGGKTNMKNEQRLSLDGPIENNTTIYGVREDRVNFDHIFPRRLGKLTYYAEQVAENKEHWVLTDTSLDFDLEKHKLKDTDISIRFNTGNCAGTEFKVIRYDHSTKKMTIQDYVDDSGEAKYVLPNHTRFPKENDEYVLLNMLMPQSYIDNAKAELGKATQDKIMTQSVPQHPYTIDCDPRYYKSTLYRPSIGDMVRLIDKPNALDAEIRITGYSFPVSNPTCYKLTLSDNISIPPAILERQRINIELNKLASLRPLDGQDGQDGQAGRDGSDLIKYSLYPSDTAVHRAYGESPVPADISCRVLLSTKNQMEVVGVDPKIEFTERNYMYQSQCNSLSHWVLNQGNATIVNDPKFGKVVQYERVTGTGAYQFRPPLTVSKSELFNRDITYYVCAKRISSSGSFNCGIQGFDSLGFSPNNYTKKVAQGDGWFLYSRTVNHSSDTNPVANPGTALNCITGTWQFAYVMLAPSDGLTEYFSAPEDIDIKNNGSSYIAGSSIVPDTDTTWVLHDQSHVIDRLTVPLILDGRDSVTYWIETSTNVVTKDNSGVLSHSSIWARQYKRTGANDVMITSDLISKFRRSNDGVASMWDNTSQITIGDCDWIDIWLEQNDNVVHKTRIQVLNNINTCANLMDNSETRSGDTSSHYIFFQTYASIFKQGDCLIFSFINDSNTPIRALITEKNSLGVRDVLGNIAMKGERSTVTINVMDLSVLLSVGIWHGVQNSAMVTPIGSFAIKEGMFQYGTEVSPWRPSSRDVEFTEFRYAISNSRFQPPVLVNTSPEPVGWTTTIVDADLSQFVWMIRARKTVSGRLLSNWSYPSRISGDGGVSIATIYLYKRSRIPIFSHGLSGILDYKFETKSLSGNLGGWFEDIPSGFEDLYVISATAIGSGLIDSINSSEWTKPILWVHKGGAEPTINSATVTLYQRAVIKPAKPVGSTTYDFTTSSLTGLSVGLWSQHIPANNGMSLWRIHSAVISLNNTGVISSPEWSAPVKIGADPGGEESEKHVFMTYHARIINTDGIDAVPTNKPTGNSTNDGWHYACEPNDIWISAKRSVDIDSGVWSYPQRISALTPEFMSYYGITAEIIRATAITSKFGTNIKGGLIMSSMVELNDGVNNNTTAGISGINYNDRNPAFWSGGNYVAAHDSKAVTIIRFDGSAKFGSTQIDKDGNLTLTKSSNIFTPVNPGDNTITPVNSAGNTITPVNPGDNTITPVNSAGNTITPVNPGDNTITPVNPGGNIITPVNPGGNIITPNISVKNKPVVSLLNKSVGSLSDLLSGNQNDLLSYNSTPSLIPGITPKTYKSSDFNSPVTSTTVRTVKVLNNGSSVEISGTIAISDIIQDTPQYPPGYIPGIGQNTQPSVTLGVGATVYIVSGSTKFVIASVSKFQERDPVLPGEVQTHRKDMLETVFFEWSDHNVPAGTYHLQVEYYCADNSHLSRPVTSPRLSLWETKIGVYRSVSNEQLILGQGISYTAYLLSLSCF